MRTNNYSSTLFSNVVPLLLLLSFSTGSAAQVFKCVDQATGKTSFTDKACPDSKPGDYVPVGNANSDAGYDPNATANEKLNRDAADKAHRAAAQAQVAGVQEREKAKEIYRHKTDRVTTDRVQIDRVKSRTSFENSMAKKQCLRGYSLEHCRSLYD